MSASYYIENFFEELGNACKNLFKVAVLPVDIARKLVCSSTRVIAEATIRGIEYIHHSIEDGRLRREMLNENEQIELESLLKLYKTNLEIAEQAYIPLELSAESISLKVLLNEIEIIQQEIDYYPTEKKEIAAILIEEFKSLFLFTQDQTFDYKTKLIKFMTWRDKQRAFDEAVISAIEGEKYTPNEEKHLSLDDCQRLLLAVRDKLYMPVDKALHCGEFADTVSIESAVYGDGKLLAENENNKVVGSKKHTKQKREGR